MNRYAGLDGYRKGWVVVWIEPGQRRFEMLGRFDQLLGQDFTRAAIDIPIGMPDAGNRGCDLEARRILGRNSPRVFTGVRRWLFEMPDYPSIRPEAQRRGEKAISRQMYGILPKICEVDSAILPSLQGRIIESHPELIFQRLNKGSPLPSKKSGDGRALRRGLLEEDGFAALDAWIASLRGTGAKVDDLFDACACAIAARDSVDKVPAQPLVDPRGLRMEIHY
jgi:predicted RNase H-like nuclease